MFFRILILYSKTLESLPSTLQSFPSHQLNGLSSNVATPTVEYKILELGWNSP